MLYLVVSDPHPSRPEDVKDQRLEWRKWLADLKSRHKVVSFYPKVGRGAVVIFDLSSNDELHILLTQWLNLVPASFTIQPLATPTEEEKLLRQG
jgi:muconolactone delta-isomerase